MRRTIAVLALAALPLAALPLFAQQQQPAPEKRPLSALPYTPTLDVPSMDLTANPCNDFYQYVCGGWMKNNPIPPDQASWSVYGKLSEENGQFLWGVLEDAAQPRADRTPAQQKIGDFFQSCMDDTQIETLGSTPLQPVLNEIAALKSKKDLASLLADQHMKDTGSGWMFGFGSDQDFGDATQVIAFAHAGGLSLPDRDYYTKTDEKSKKTREQYEAHVAKMLQLIGESKAEAAKDAKTVLRIETDLAKSALTRVERRNPYNLYHKMSEAELKKLTPSFDWNTYLTRSGLTTVKTLNVTEPKFFKALNTAIQDVPLSDWRAYLRWHAVHARAPYLSSAFVDENFDFFSKTLRGVKQLPPRWKRCVRLVDRDLGEALGQEFVRRTFTADTKAKTVDMTRRIETAMANEIKSLDWMTDATKQRALEKLQQVANKIGYPDRWRDYSSLDVKRGDFYGNVTRATVFESKRELAKIGKPVDRGEWGMTPPTVNAYYNAQMNDINFPAGVLQPPLYDPKMDDAPNYGNTGSTIGHELTHAFDDEGRQFDGAGNLKDWWTPEDAKKFEERIQCVRDQYAQYTIVDDIKINSRLTLGEDVADLGGTILAYDAWKDVTRGRDLKPADGLSPDQRFFVGLAQWACGDSRDEAKRVRARTDPHSPPKYRINGVVANMPEFREAFGCKVGQPMVHEPACRVW